MTRQRVLTICMSLVATAAAYLGVAVEPAHAGYCQPVGVCVESCSPEVVTQTCEEYRDIGCIFLTAECWESTSGQNFPECNSGGYSKLFCYYSH